MSLLKYLEILDMRYIRKERNDPQFDQSVDIEGQEYPNYNVIPNYNYKQELIPGFHLLIGLSSHLTHESFK